MEIFNFDKKTVKKVIGLGFIGLAFILLGLYSYLITPLNSVLFWLAVISIFALSLWRIEIGFLALIFELVIGSKGYLFSFPIFGYLVSLRLALFGSLFIAWLLTRFRDRRWRFWQTPYRWSALAFLGMLIIGAINGLMHNEANILFFDLNGWLFFGLFFLAFDIIRTRLHVQKLILVILGSSLALALITIVVFLNFSVVNYNPDLIIATQLNDQQLAQLGQTPESAQLGQTLELNQELVGVRYDELTEDKSLQYRWLRDTGLAEVSYLGGRFFRVFFYSHIYILFSLILILAYVVKKKERLRSETKIAVTLFSLLFFVTLLISFSRSILVGLIISLIILVFYVSKRTRWKVLIWSVVALGLIVMTLSVFAPATLTLIQDRIYGIINPATEVASQTRVNILKPIWEKIQAAPILGNGYGTTIVYATFISGTDDIQYISAYLFEWTYLDIIVKLGVIGLLVLFWLLYRVIRTLITIYKQHDQIIGLWGIISVLAFLLINITTPYLNHPIGLGWIISLAVISIAIISEKSSHETN